jgi:hypothetical protein
MYHSLIRRPCHSPVSDRDTPKPLNFLGSYHYCDGASKSVLCCVLLPRR